MTDHERGESVVPHGAVTEQSRSVIQSNLTREQQVLLGGAHGNVMACLDILNCRARNGTRAKPTVAELNNIVRRLTSASFAIETTATWKTEQDSVVTAPQEPSTTNPS